MNLLFSTQAAYAAPLIALSQNRQADTDRIKAEHDYRVNRLALTYLIAWHRDAHVEQTGQYAEITLSSLGHGLIAPPQQTPTAPKGAPIRNG